MKNKGTLVDLILAAHQRREARERLARTVARNVARGRCGECRKKPYDCRCN